jgi:hypothetical protein
MGWKIRGSNTGKAKDKIFSKTFTQDLWLTQPHIQ